MEQPIQFYNTRTRQKEIFQPLNPPFVGMYVCGPTVYGDAHLGHARPYVVFDMIYRYLQHTGYRVRYVRNITDVGHLENDADEGEDKIAKKARLEQLEPMEVAHHYTEVFERDMRRLNILSPSIEPRASGHIIEQVELIQKIMQAGFAYETNGSVYFDVSRYSQVHPYGELSGRVLEDLQAGAGTARRTLEGQDEKRNPADFALWKKASPEHIMRWPSPWSDGFPGWHIECSAMSKKYLGPHFDIHGGGMDLLFPHHECEIAQSVAGNGQEPVKYWIHNNMLTINGQKMGKSLGNFITIDQLLNGTHPMLEQPYSAMTVRFFILQAQYRSTLDFSNAALQAAEKGFNRLMQAFVQLSRLKGGESSSVNVEQWIGECYAAMNDDFNSAILIAKLFEAATWINQVSAGQASITENDLSLLKEKYAAFITDVLGLVPEENDGSEKIEGLMELIIDLRKNARTQKDFATSDKIRDQLSALGFVIKDSKEGTHWEYN